MFLICLGIIFSTEIPFGSSSSAETTAAVTAETEISQSSWEQETDKRKPFTWVDDDEGSRFYLNNGVYETNHWLEKNGEFYYAGEDGYVLRDTVTPDGGKVDENGEWIIEDYGSGPVPGFEELKEMLGNAAGDVGMSLTGSCLIEDAGEYWIMHDVELVKIASAYVGYYAEETLGTTDLYVRKDAKFGSGAINSVYSLEEQIWEDMDESWELWKLRFDGNGYVAAGWIVGAAG